MALRLGDRGACLVDHLRVLAACRVEISAFAVRQHALERSQQVRGRDHQRSVGVILIVGVVGLGEQLVSDRPVLGGLACQ